jgi:hypothetical protein
MRTDEGEEFENDSVDDMIEENKNTDQRNEESDNDSIYYKRYRQQREQYEDCRGDNEDY